ncbi:MAG: metallophosphoesterase family protein [Pseudomonadota bacterium]
MALFGLKRRSRADEPDVWPFSLPEGVRVYAIGDIHGQLHLLQKMQQLIARDVRNRPAGRVIEVYLGDYVDRGENSAGVLSELVDMSLGRRERVFIRGNHDALLEDFVTINPTEAEPVLREWLSLGGLQTLVSYRVPVSLYHADASEVCHRLAEAFPSAHLRFLSHTCIPWFQIGGYFFTHAGVRPEVPLDAQDEDDLMWIREEFLEFDDLFDARIVHGHTIVDRVDVRPNRINVDTGAFGSGRLSCVVLEGSDVGVLVAR